jgi:hypothetical protein
MFRTLLVASTLIICQASVAQPSSEDGAAHHDLGDPVTRLVGHWSDGDKREDWWRLVDVESGLFEETYLDYRGEPQVRQVRVVEVKGTEEVVLAIESSRRPTVYILMYVSSDGSRKAARRTWTDEGERVFYYRRSYVDEATSPQQD